MLPTLPLSGFRWGLERLAQPEMLANLLFLGLGASALCFATWNFTHSKISGNEFCNS